MRGGFFCCALFCLLPLLLGPATAESGLQFYPISTGLREAGDCRVAGALGGAAVVAWVEADSVWTRRWSGSGLDPAVNHGPGRLPDVAFAESNFTLAFVRDGAIVVREGDGQAWTDAALYAFALDVTLPRLTGWRLGWWQWPWPRCDQGLYLCFQTEQGAVRFAERILGVWQDAEHVLEEQSYAMPRFAQAVPVPDDAGSWRPRVYAMGETDLFHAERADGVWQPPAAVRPGEFLYGGEFAVAVGLDTGQHVLSNGPQPTCPCNVIHYSHGYPPGGWSEPEDLTVRFDYFTWPQDPAVAVDLFGRVHVVWFQQHYGLSMQPTWRGLFYRVLAGGVWEDLSDQFCCQRGKDADMDLRRGHSPAIVWTQSDDDDAPSRVYLALDPEALAAPPPAAAAAPALSAQPNPFNPRTVLRFTLAAPAAVELSIFDAGGRRLRTLLAGQLPAGEQRLAWDGRDAAGRQLPSGVYLARLSGDGFAAAAKLLLLR